VASFSIEAGKEGRGACWELTGIKLLAGVDVGAGADASETDLATTEATKRDAKLARAYDRMDQTRANIQNGKTVKFSREESPNSFQIPSSRNMNPGRV
jgi:hypothetical protein